MCSRVFCEISEALENDAVIDSPAYRIKQFSRSAVLVSRYALRVSVTWSMPPPTSGAAIISTSVRAGSDICTLTNRAKVISARRDVLASRCARE